MSIDRPGRYLELVDLRIALAFALLAACGGDGASSSTTTLPTTSTTSATSAEDAIGFVVAVVDGDSLQIDIGSAVEEVRLIGINAPEAGECWADESANALVDLAQGTVSVAGEERDQFGRLLGRVFAGSTEIDLEMVLSGNAIALSESPDAVRLIAAEEEALSRSRGMWSATACGPAGAEGLALRDIVFDAQGPDGENPNGEYVVVINEGANADLTGWVLRDESSIHRFAFPDGFGLEPGETVVIRSGCGNDAPGELYWCADGPVWNNGGDMALLLDPSGNVAARLRY